MRPRQVASVLAKLLPLREPVLMWGPPGIGKTDIGHQTAALLGADLIVSHPIVDDPTDYKGFPFAVEVNGRKQASFLPFGELCRAIDATKLTIWLMDDIGQALPAVQAALMQLLHGKRLNGHRLSDMVVFLGASNRQEDRAGVHRMITPLANRFATHLDVEVSVEDWQQWAIGHGIRPEVRGYINWKPEALHQFSPDSGSRAFASPRSYEKASNILRAGVSEDELPTVLAGCIGTGSGAELTAFCRTYYSLPDLEHIRQNPDTATVPSEPDVLFSVIGALTERLRQDAPRWHEPCLRYYGRMEELPATVAMRDSQHVYRKFANHPLALDWLRKHPNIGRPWGEEN